MRVEKNIIHMTNKINDNNIPELSIEDMSQILDRVFEACQMEPVRVPLESVVSYTKYRMERFSIQKTVALIAFVLFLLVPALFIAPRFSIAGADSPNGAETVQIRLDNLAPVRSITAVIDDVSMPVHDEGNHIYTVQPAKNGTMHITVTLFNGQQNTQEYNVMGADNTAPVLTDYSVNDDKLTLIVDDGDGLGINFEGVCAETSNDTIEPVSYDSDTGEIVFALPEGDIIVVIPDMAGNILQLTISA